MFVALASLGSHVVLPKHSRENLVAVVKLVFSWLLSVGVEREAAGHSTTLTVDITDFTNISLPECLHNKIRKYAEANSAVPPCLARLREVARMPY